MSGPPISAQSPTVSPTAIAVNPSVTRLSVATAMITNIRTNDSSQLEIHTHAIDGLTESDFILAAKADAVR